MGGGGGAGHLAYTKNHPGHQLLSLQDTEMVMLALKTLATFNTKGLVLLLFVRNVVSEYLKNPNVSVRTQAVETCMSLLVTHGGVMHQEDTHRMDSHNRKFIQDDRQFKRQRSIPYAHGRTQTARFRCETLGHILTLAVADRDGKVRKAAIASLSPSFDKDLAQANMLKSLFVALNDEIFEIREMGIVVVVD